MASLRNISKAPKIINMNPNQLPVGQRNELLPAISNAMRNTQSQVPNRIVQPQQPIGQQSASDITSPLQAVELLKQLIPSSYQQPELQNDPRVTQRFQQLQDALSNYNPSVNQLQNERAQNLQDQYVAMALNAKPATYKSNSQLQQEALTNLYDVYNKQNKIQQDLNDQAQVKALSDALGVPVGSVENFWKDYISPSMQSFNTYQSLLEKGKQSQALEQAKQEGRLESKQFEEQLPSEQLSNALKTAQVTKILHDLKQPTPAQQKLQQKAQEKQDANQKTLFDIGYAEDLIKKNPRLLGIYSQPMATVGRVTGGAMGMNKADLQKRGEIMRAVGTIKNSLISQARANGQTGINTMAEINQATAGLDENSSAQELLGALKAMRNIANNQNPYRRVGNAPVRRKSAPKAGFVKNGYRFNGGDPSNKQNWSKI